MAQQIINIGTAPNDGTGDPIRVAFNKTNSNFTEVYGLIPEDVSDLTDTTDLLFSGDFDDLTNKPTIPETILDLGITDGAPGQVLTTNGAGVFTFTSSGGGGGTGLASRQQLSGSSGNIGNNASVNFQISGYKGYVLYKVQTSAAAWVRLYASSAARTADESRTQGEDPLPSSGVIAEVVTTGAQTVLIAPGVFGFNDDDPVSGSIPVRVTNLSGGAATITVTLTAVELEV
jgi:hypothetical protein